MSPSVWAPYLNSASNSNAPSGSLWVESESIRWADGSTERWVTFDEIVGEWHFNEGSGSTANDNSGNANDGSLNGDPVWTTGQYSSALEFDGSGDYVQVPSSSSLNPNHITMAAWVYTGDSGTGNMVFNKEGIYEMAAGTSGLALAINAQGCSGWCNGWMAQDVGNISSNTWTHVATTWNGDVGKFYIDGSLIQTADPGGGDGSIVSNSRDLGIGARDVDDTPSAYFNGRIDEPRIYDRPLTQKEIESLARGATADSAPSGSAWIEQEQLRFADSSGFERAINGRPVLGSQAHPAISCNDVYQNYPEAKDGLYYIDPDQDGSNVQEVRCDMGTDNSGWTLIYNYDHAGGTNPAPNEGSWPLDHQALSHMDNLGQFGFTSSNINSVRLRCETSNHNRIVHYISTDADTIQGVLDDSTTVGYASVANAASYLPEHSGNLPDAAASDTGESEPSPSMFGPRFPMYEGGAHHWSIGEPGGSGDRWECDDYPGGDMHETLHQIWIKGGTQSFSTSGPSGSAWIESGLLHYVDADGKERVLRGWD